jgi:Glycine zipper 2TM domain
MNKHKLSSLTLAAGFLALSACGGSAPPPPAPAPAAIEAPAPAAEAAASALAARESEVAARESEIAAREAQLAEAQTQAAAKPVPVPKSAMAKPVNKPARAKPVIASSDSALPKPAPAPRFATVPSGTTLNMALASDISTKTAKTGDNLTARLTSDVLVDGRVVVPAGTTVTGQVTGVVSGSSKVGGTPMLTMRFDRLELEDGQRLPIAGEVVQKGRSDNLRDTAKIVGGAAAGAVIGKQVGDDNKGKVIGGLLGGAIGAVAAQKTGTEVQLAAGTALSINLSAPVEVQTR